MRLKYNQFKLFELPNHEWWSQIKRMHLDVDTSCFKEWYYGAECNVGFNYDTIVVSHENRPIAIAMYTVWNSMMNIKTTEFTVFVIHDYRQQGVGKKLFKKVKYLTQPDKVFVYPHDDTSDAFYTKVYPKHYKNQDVD